MPNKTTTKKLKSKKSSQLFGFVCWNLESIQKKKLFKFLPSGRSCLFAKIKIIASRISLSLIILCNSCLASSIRSLSAQSTTKIKPCVPGDE